MLKRQTIVAIGMTLVIAACDGFLAPGNRTADDAVVRWGTSFGMCLGYCIEEMAVDGDVVRLTRRGWVEAQTPPQVQERVISNEDWQDLVERIEAARIENLDDVYGCPDCADGGAEWVELESGGSRKRVTFQFSQPPDALEDVVAELRALRGRFPDP